MQRFSTLRDACLRGFERFKTKEWLLLEKYWSKLTKERTSMLLSGHHGPRWNARRSFGRCKSYGALHVKQLGNSQPLHYVARAVACGLVESENRVPKGRSGSKVCERRAVRFDRIQGIHGGLGIFRHFWSALGGRPFNSGHVFWWSCSVQGN